MLMTLDNAIEQSEAAGGLYLSSVAVGDVIEVRTESRLYRIVYCGDGEAMISGHPKFCPQPLLVKIHGSTWGGSALKGDFIGAGMRLEFLHPQHGIVTTSRIVEIRTLDGGAREMAFA